MPPTPAHPHEWGEVRAGEIWWRKREGRSCVGRGWACWERPRGPQCLACAAPRDWESVSVCLSRHLWPEVLTPGLHSALLAQALLTP